MDKKQFTIAQLRQDKIIYAVEACATNLACLLVFFLAIPSLRAQRFPNLTKEAWDCQRGHRSGFRFHLIAV